MFESKVQEIPQNEDTPFLSTKPVRLFKGSCLSPSCKIIGKLMACMAQTESYLIIESPRRGETFCNKRKNY